MLMLNVHPKKLDRLHPEARNIAWTFPVVLAGGAIRDACFNQTISDYDFFMLESMRDSDMVALSLVLERRGFKQIFACPLGELYSYSKTYPNVDAVPPRTVKFQFIRKGTYFDALNVLYTFDFNACRFALMKCGKILTDKSAIRDVVTKKLSINTITHPSSSINRLTKYRKKGYYVGSAIQEIVEIIRTPGFVSHGEELYLD